MLILALLIVLLVPSVAQSAITCTGTSFPFSTPTDPQTQAYTVPTVTNGITLIHAAVRNGARTVSSVTIGGSATTQVATGLSSTSHAAALFYRLNVAAGSQSIAVDWDGVPFTYVLTAVTCDNVSQSAPISVSNTATGTTGATITVDCTSTTASQLVLDFAAADSNSTLTRGGGQTNIDQDTGDAGALVAGSSSEPGGGTITMSNTITSDDWSTFCVALEPASARRTIAPLVIQ